MQTTRLAHGSPEAPTVYKDLMQYEIVGSYHFDSAFLKKAERFIKDDGKPLNQRAAVVKKYDKALGMKTISASDQAIVRQFIKDLT